MDWSQTQSINEDWVVLRHEPNQLAPRVTIGMPTYKRAATFQRALASVAAQTYRNFVLIISDNAGRDPATLATLDQFREGLPSVTLIAQPENRGALGNLAYLLSLAQTEYFMWLADDDVITPNYLEELVALLDANTESPAAMGYWQSMRSPEICERREQSYHTQRSLWLRAACYVAGVSDDALFYGLHRTHLLRRCRFDDYVYPNRGVLTNFCYVFLFDHILQGPIVYSKNAGWICHNYSEKEYTKASAQGVRDRAHTLIRRINVYALYCAKAYTKHPLLLAPVLLAALYGLLRDMFSAAWRISARAIG